jgi:hypothetical protein
MSLEIKVVKTAPGRISVVQVGVQGQRGPQGPAGGAAIVGESTTSGLAGTTIPLTGFSDPSEYHVAVSYAEDPGANGVLWVEKSAEEFVVKHYGPESVKFSYIVSPTTGS